MANIQSRHHFLIGDNSIVFSIINVKSRFKTRFYIIVLKSPPIRHSCESRNLAYYGKDSCLRRNDGTFKKLLLLRNLLCFKYNYSFKTLFINNI